MPRVVWTSSTRRASLAEATLLTGSPLCTDGREALLVEAEAGRLVSSVGLKALEGHAGLPSMLAASSVGLKAGMLAASASAGAAPGRSVSGITLKALKAGMLAALCRHLPGWKVAPISSIHRSKSWQDSEAGLPDKADSASAASGVRLEALACCIQASGALGSQICPSWKDRLVNRCRDVGGSDLGEAGLTRLLAVVLLVVMDLRFPSLAAGPLVGPRALGKNLKG
mmetsp:Transcript_43041/g.77831  ORF Transcript_43041/g.77831 Transcript_43041/m.77831 type:complete len:226 (-) Transcript_43041:1231-1908(-)